MCSLTWGALNGMQKRTRPAAAPFLFAGSGIDLAVTSTEFAGHYDAVPLSHELVFDEAHRHVFRIHGAGGGSLDPDVGMLAFAARATASFPGAFAPVSLDHFRQQIKGAGDKADWDDIAHRYLRRYPGDEKGIVRRFVDGGVLDNMPFDAAIAAIRRRTSQVEVRRALVYVEPSPTVVASTQPLDLPDLDVPEANVVMETFRSVSTIPLSQTMGDQIARVRERNDRVLALRSVIEQRFDAVAKRVDDIAREAAAGGPNPLADAGGEAARRLVAGRVRQPHTPAPTSRRPTGGSRSATWSTGSPRRSPTCADTPTACRASSSARSCAEPPSPPGSCPTSAARRHPSVGALRAADRVPARVRRRVRAAPDRVRARRRRLAVRRRRTGRPGPRPDRRREARPLRARVGSRARVGHARRRRRPPSPGTRHVRRRGASGTPPARRVRPGLGSRDEAQRVRRRERLRPRGARDARASRAREGDGLLRRDDVHPPPRRARRLARGAASGAARGPAAQVHRVSRSGMRSRTRSRSRTGSASATARSSSTASARARRRSCSLPTARSPSSRAWPRIISARSSPARAVSRTTCGAGSTAAVSSSRSSSTGRRGRPGAGDRREGVHARRVRRRARGGVEPRPERS